MRSSATAAPDSACFDESRGSTMPRAMYVVWTRPEDQHLGWSFLKKPNEIISGETGPNPRRCRDDNAIEAFTP